MVRETRWRAREVREVGCERWPYASALGWRGEMRKVGCERWPYASALGWRGGMRERWP